MLLIVIADSFDETLPKWGKFIGGRFNCGWSLGALRVERQCCTWRTTSTTNSDTRTVAMADNTAAITSEVMAVPVEPEVAATAPAPVCAAAVIAENGNKCLL
ncbi:hypothetical protein NP493_2164g00005 [Ridgeia piscesae]|uniref:Uncharacterized protein n=1 Tax=Ridgeia piscesae TaxID=27915 RepID=A0AAD9JKE2_RIDPI|nr:hypothetical protein NP493_2164g00005 [Ridgeia piscesae]